MKMPSSDSKELQRQRTRAVRTAWALAALAVVIFVVFILSGVMSQ